MRWACMALCWAAVGCGSPAADEPAPVAVTAADAATLASSAPSTKKLRAWLGDLSALAAADRATYESSVADFPALRVAGPNDWLAQHQEEPQTFGTFAIGERNVPGANGRDHIYILPMGDVPMQTELRDYAQDFFTLQVTVLPAVDISAEPFTRRMNGKHEQILADDVQDYLQKRLPSNAYALIGLTMEDLYPGEDWNYVFGMASVKHRTGVFSFARYDPRFYDSAAAPSEKLLQQRALKILSHEVGHMFGITHCVHFSCIMNGVNHADELDGSPPHLCPVCLRKLQLATEFDARHRYAALRVRYVAMGWTEAASFVQRRLGRIDGAASAPEE